MSQEENTKRDRENRDFARAIFIIVQHSSWTLMNLFKMIEYYKDIQRSFDECSRGSVRDLHEYLSREINSCPGDLRVRVQRVFERTEFGNNS